LFRLLRYLKPNEQYATWLNYKTGKTDNIKKVTLTDATFCRVLNVFFIFSTFLTFKKIFFNVSYSTVMLFVIVT